MRCGFVYIIQSKSCDIYYVGVSKNPKNRLYEHNSGKVKATKNKGPWVLKFSQIFPSLREAKQIEFKLKGFKSRKVVEKIIKDGYIKTRVENRAVA